MNATPAMLLLISSGLWAIDSIIVEHWYLFGWSFLLMLIFIIELITADK